MVGGPAGSELRRGLVAGGRSDVVHDHHDHVPGEGSSLCAIRTCSPRGSRRAEAAQGTAPLGLGVPPSEGVGRSGVATRPLASRPCGACEPLAPAARPPVVVDEQLRTAPTHAPDGHSRSQRRATDSPRPRAAAQHPSAPFTTNFGPETPKRSAGLAHQHQHQHQHQHEAVATTGASDAAASGDASLRERPHHRR